MKRDYLNDAGLVVVGLAAAILTFTTLRDLGSAVGIGGSLFGLLPLAWLVPITIDAAGMVAARIWLRRTAGDRAVAFARALTWTCIGGSVAGNAGQHAMAAFHIPPPWWCVVAVTAVPPATLGAVVHLYHLLSTTPVESRVETASTPSLPITTPLEAEVERVEEQVETVEDSIAAGAGRKVLMSKHGLTEHQARQALKVHREKEAA